jgi:hypothetical protein
MDHSSRAPRVFAYQNAGRVNPQSVHRGESTEFPLSNCPEVVPSRRPVSLVSVVAICAYRYAEGKNDFAEVLSEAERNPNSKTNVAFNA